MTPICDIIRAMPDGNYENPVPQKPQPEPPKEPRPYLITPPPVFKDKEDDGEDR